MSLARLKCVLLVFLILQILPAPAPAAVVESLVLSVHPYLPATEIVQRFTPLADHLSMKTGRRIILHVAKDYDDHIEQIGRNSTDLAYMGPASYVITTDRYGRKPLLARLEIDGKPYFKGVIVVRESSTMRGLKDLTGKRFAFGDYNSTMSHLIPRYLLIKEGVELEELAGHTHLKNHNNVALSVLSGDFDAGAIKEEVFHKYKDRGLRMLAATPKISEHLFITSTTLSPATIASLREALLHLNDTPEGREIISGIKSTVTALVPVVESDYDNLRVILQNLTERGVLK